MTNVILQPSGNRYAREHYVDTVTNLVELSSLQAYLPDSVYRALLELHPSGTCAFWGVTAGKKMVNRNKWHRIQQGDIALFARDGDLIASGVVTSVFQSAEAAKKLWGVDDSGETWEYMYSLDEIQEISVPYKAMNQIVGYAENNIVQGFQVLDEEKSDRLIEALGLQSESLTLQPVEHLWDETLRELDANLDIKVEGLRRAEQSYARHRLLKGKSTGTCLLCGHTFHKDFLIAAHIKKRSSCTDDEKRDIDANMMLACIFGCDILYEKGYIAVQNNSILISGRLTDQTAQNYATRFNSRNLQMSNVTAQYFDWHFANTYKK